MVDGESRRGWIERPCWPARAPGGRVARGWLVLSIAVMAAVLVACRVPGDTREHRVEPFDEVSAAVASSELPLLVPTELLDGWVLDGITSDEEQGVTVLNRLTFISPEGLGLPVTLCVALSDEVDRCIGEDPQRLVTVEPLTAVWRASELDATSAVETLNAWAAVPLTLDWEEVSWLQSAP